MTVETLGLTAERCVELLDAREVSCRELVEAYLDRIEAHDGDFNAFVRTRRDLALAEADAFDRDGRSGLQGVPIALKDILCTRGEETTAGSRILAGHKPMYDAGAVTRVKNAGMIPLGKTNMDEFAMGSSTEHSAYGVTHNPWDPTRVPGGSSGGSAAAVAAGFAPLALGTDTGGSIRQPAALCGVVGLKPTYGAVSRHGLIAFGSSLDQVGPFALTVRDAALAFATIAGKDHCDSTSVELSEPVRIPDREDLAGVRIGVPTKLLDQGVEPGVRASFDASLEIAEGLGASVSEVELPHAHHGLPAYYLIAPAEASANLARFDGVRYGLRLEEPGDTVVDMYGRTRSSGFGAEVKRRIMLGTYVLSAGYYDAYYGTALKVRTLIRQDFDRGVRRRRRDRHAGLADRGVHDRRAGRRPVGDVRLRRAHGAAEPGRAAGYLDPLRPVRGASRRPPARGAAVLREPAARRRARDGAGAAVRPGAAAAGPGGRMSDWEPVIGLEIHVQLNTETKMFCCCENRYGADPNTLTCPLCLGHPGVLPLINQAAVDRAIKIGLALNSQVAESCRFHRKNYFYPDSPKAYQISQYDEPICSGGHLEVDGTSIGITRAHLEEDAAKLVHAGGEAGRIAGAEHSLVDFNRCGTPLVEIVTEPDIRSPEQATRFLGLLKNTLQTIGVSDCDMEKGSLRCDANVSVRPAGATEFGTKTELKNMNSFKFLAEGMAAEIERQIGVLEGGGTVEQETLHYDPRSGALRSLRSKEEAHDYRYFPEPDLVPLAPSAELIERLRGRAARASGRAHRPLRARLFAARAVRGRPQCRRRRGGLLRAGCRAGRRPQGRCRLGHQPANGRRRRACKRPRGHRQAGQRRHDHRDDRQAGVRAARRDAGRRSCSAGRAAGAGQHRR